MYVTAKGVQLKLSGATTNWSPVRSDHLLTGTSGNDIFFASPGDVMTGGAGDDQYSTWSTDFTINEKPGDGVDTLTSYAYGAIILPQNVENLILSGAGATYAMGNKASNIICAGTAGAYLDGGAGDDVLVGGAGRDTFSIAAGNGSDAIENFQAGKDLVRIAGYGIADFAALKPLMSQVGSDVAVNLGHGETLVLRNTDLASLDATDFRLTDTASTPLPSSAFAAPAAGSGLTQLAGAQQVYIANGWAILNNTWNSAGLKYGTDYRVNTTYHHSDLTGGTTFNWSYPVVATTPGASSKILAYPEVSFGVNPYGSGQNPTDKAAVLPAQLSAITDLKAHYDLSISGATEGFNVSYDIWLTNKPNGDASTITNEVMIWLHQGNFDPFGERVGTYTDGDFSAQIYYNAATHYTAIVANSDALVGDLDLAKVFKALGDLGIVSNTEYLASVELGAEVVSGSGSLAVNNLDLDVSTTGTDGTVVTKTVTGAGTTTQVSDQLVFHGTEAADMLTGNASANTLYGHGGNDVLDGKAGADVMYGGTGDDTYVVDNAGDKVVENAAEGTDTVKASIGYILGDNLENLTLTGTGAINGTGNALDNVITGNGAANVLDGAGGRDTLIGGAGDDTYLIRSGNEQIVEAHGGGNDMLIASVDYVLAAGQEVEKLQVAQGNHAINLTGNEFNNSLYGNVGNNVLNGGGGNDIFDGGGGIDTLIGGTGADTYIIRSGLEKIVEAPGGGNDQVLTTVDYTLGAGQEIETLSVMDANSTKAFHLTGNEFANAITGGAGNDTIDGGGGDDYLVGGAGNDMLIGGSGNDLLNNDQGADTLVGGAGDDVFHIHDSTTSVVEAAGGGRDTVLAYVSYALGAGQEIETLQAVSGTAAIDLTGNAFGNYIVGNAGANALDGGAGNDVLEGAAGADRLTGGLGADTFLFREGDTGKTSATADTILDFSHAQGDKIDLSRLDANIKLQGDQTFAMHSSGDDHIAGSMWLTHDGDFTVVNLDHDGDGVPDHMINVKSAAPLVGSDFVY